MNTPQPARMGAVRSRLSLASPVKFSLDDMDEEARAHHDVLVKHGYKRTETWRSKMGGPHVVHYYRHPSGHIAAHYEAHGKTMTGRASALKEHSNHKDLDKTLRDIHGKD